MAAPKRGFAKSKESSIPSFVKRKETDETSKQAVRNLFSVCSHIQDPALYQPTWADNCEGTILGDGRKAVVATKDVQKGQALTLFPIHALGLRWLHRKDTRIKSKKQNNKYQDQDDVEFVAYDLDRDGDGLMIRLSIPLDKEQPAYQPILGTSKDKVLFSMINPQRETTPGWLGGNIHSGTSSNCFTLPLPGAAPLCAIVASCDIKAGDEIVQGTTASETINECRDLFMREYSNELIDIKSYIEMACKPLQQHVVPAVQASQSDNEKSTSIGPFHAINMNYPGLRQLNENPDIFAVDDFLTPDECERIIAKALRHMRPCLVKNEETGAVEQDPSRTNTDANLPQREVPTIVDKLTNLLSCEADRLEILQVLRYQAGQKFSPHTDGFESAVSACGFEDANRVATAFTYLNDVESGGGTKFLEASIDIQPKRGMAVIHFPSDIQLREDERTIHEGMPAVDEKWLLTTWLWSKARSHTNYSEDVLETLSSDTI